MDPANRTVLVLALALVTVTSTSSLGLTHANPSIGHAVAREDAPTASPRGAWVDTPQPCANCVVATVEVGNQPEGAAFDPANQDVYVANADSGNVSVISDVDDSVSASITVGNGPTGVVFDPGNGDIYVSNAVSGTVSVIAGSSNTVIATVAVGLTPGPIAYDSGNGGRLYVLNEASSNMSVISAATNRVTATIPVGGPATGPTGSVYDPANGDIYISDMTSSETVVGVLSTATNTMVANITGFNRPVGMTYDSSNGYLYVANENANDVAVVSGSTNTLVSWIPSYPVGSGPVAAAFDSGNGAVYFADGYHAGAGSVTGVYGSNNTVDVTIPTGLTTNGLAYDSTTGSVYATNARSGNVSVISPAPAYPVTFTEQGLPSGVGWSVSVAGVVYTSTSASLHILEPDGTHAYTVASESSSWQVVNQTGNVTVSGSSPAPVVSTFVYAYAITVSQTGLPTGTHWAINVSGTLAAAGSPLEPPATALSRLHYSFSSNSSSLTFSLPNGTYSYTVSSSLEGWSANRATGTEVVNGSASPSTVGETFSSGSSPSTIFGLPSMFFYGLAATVVVAFVCGALFVQFWRGRAGGISPPPRVAQGPSPPSDGPPARERDVPAPGGTQLPPKGGTS